jgi:hypothetical protein
MYVKLVFAGAYIFFLKVRVLQKSTWTGREREGEKENQSFFS